MLRESEKWILPEDLYGQEESETWIAVWPVLDYHRSQADDRSQVSFKSWPYVQHTRDTIVFDIRDSQSL